MNAQNVDEKKIQYVGCCCPAGLGWPVFWGITLVLLGVFGLLSTILPLQHLGRYILPAFLVIWGGYILFSLRTARN